MINLHSYITPDIDYDNEYPILEYNIKFKI